MGALLFSLLLTAASFARSLVLGPLVDLHAGGFAQAVSIDGDVMALSTREAVQMLKRNLTGWTIEAVLEQPRDYEKPRDDRFGDAQSVKGDTIVIGASFNGGRAYVFRRRENGSWPLEATLQPPDGSGMFGWGVSFDDETAVIGAPFFSHNGLSEAGVAYVYVRNNTSWSLQAQLKAGDATAGAEFGRAVSIDGNRILARGGGAAYLFERANGAWTQVAKLVGKLPFSSYGSSEGVCVRGKTLVATSKNSVTVFMRDQLDKPKTIKPIGSKGDQIGPFDMFGISVKVSESEDIIVVAAEGFGAYLYQRNGSRWVNASLVHAPPASPLWAGSVGISGSTFVIGTTSGAYAIEVGA